MKKLNKDIIEKLFNLLNWNDILNLRSVNKFYKLTFGNWFWNKDHHEVYPSKTMISVKVCDVCNKSFSHYLNQYQLPWYNLPRPVYVFCSNVDCIINIYKSVILEAKNKNYLIVLKNFIKLNENRKIQIPRSNNEITFARVNQNFVIEKNDTYNLFVSWNDYCKTVNLDNEIIKKSIIEKPIFLKI